MNTTNTETQITCHRCETDLREDGFCKDVTCPHSDWHQDIDLNRLDGSDPQYAEVHESEKRIVINAECYSDDVQQCVNFDAALYFYDKLGKGKINQVIQSLIDIDFGGNYDADYVCEFFEENQTKPLFEYLNAVNEYRNPRDGLVGFECHVNREDVIQWLRQNSPNTLDLFQD